MPAIAVIQIRRGTAAAWVSANPVLATGEEGWESDTGKFKIGDGSTVWNSLAYEMQVGQIGGLGTGIAAFLATPSSANLAAAVTGETGSGALVFATSPTLVTPALGTPASGVLSNCTAATQTAGDSTTKLATTAFVQAATTALLPHIVASGSLKGQSTAVTSVAAFTPGTAGVFHVHAVLNVVAVTLDVVIVSVTYTDENGNAQTMSSNSVSAIGDNSYDVNIWSGASTAITVKTTLVTSTGTISYDVAAIVIQLL